MTPQQIQESIVQEQADRHAAKNSIIDRLQAENAALKEQVESDAIVSYIEGRINILCNKLAAKDETIALIAEQHKVKVLTDALEFAQQTIGTLHLDAGDGECHYPIIDDALDYVKEMK